MVDKPEFGLRFRAAISSCPDKGKRADKPEEMIGMSCAIRTRRLSTFRVWFVDWRKMMEQAGRIGTIGTPPVFNFLRGAVAGGWCRFSDMTEYVGERNVSELLIRYGNLSKFGDELAIARPVLQSGGGCESEIMWKEARVDWLSLATSAGRLAAMTLSNDDIQLLTLNPRSPLCVSAGWAKDVVWAVDHGFYRIVRPELDVLEYISFEGGRTRSSTPLS